jgi:hypothetical protein
LKGSAHALSFLFIQYRILPYASSKDLVVATGTSATAPRIVRNRHPAAMVCKISNRSNLDKQCIVFVVPDTFFISANTLSI